MRQPGGWEQRLYAGLRLPGMDEPQLALARALGEMGVEAEFFLLLTGAEASLAGDTRPVADHFLRQLDDSCMRICAVAASLEVATQGYLSALEARYPQAHLADSVAEPWWPAFSGFTLSGDPLELRLRRCGYSYRHAIEAHLGSTIEAIAEQLALTLHALYTLPPAGVLPIAALYHGLYELSSALQGHIVPHHIIEASTEASSESPGLLLGISLLRQLYAQEDHTIQADISWVQAQLAQARQTLARLGVRRSPLAALARLGAKPAPMATPDTAAWVARSIRDWEDALKHLTALAREERAVRR
jgi:hypothetical protein